MLSGIQPLTLGEGSSGLGNEIVMVNSDGSNSDVFASEVRYSMPKKGGVIDLTQMPICSISPIIRREENNSEVIHDQIMTNKEDELNQRPKYIEQLKDLVGRHCITSFSPVKLIRL